MVALRGQRVLVVEDEHLISMLLEDMLAELGCVVAGTAMTKAEAFQLIGSTEFDAAVLDVSIDGSDSFDIAGALRDQRVPFIFATGHGSNRIAPEFAGYPVLKKPYLLDDLSNALGSLALHGSGSGRSS
jgi:DNA-binding response OmpR family regulator